MFRRRTHELMNMAVHEANKVFSDCSSPAPSIPPELEDMIENAEAVVSIDEVNVEEIEAEDLDSDDTDKDPTWHPGSMSEETGVSINDIELDLSAIDHGEGVSTTQESNTQDDQSCDENASAIVEHMQTDCVAVLGDIVERATTIVDSRELIVTTKKPKINRKEQKDRKDHGLSYVTRQGKQIPEKVFHPVTNCCRLRCYEKCDPDTQQNIFNNFMKKDSVLKDEILCAGIILLNKTSERKGRGKKLGEEHDRLITVHYTLTVNSSKVRVCKEMFMKVHGIKKGKVDILILKLKSSKTGFIDGDKRGRHERKNKMTEERTFIKQFIDTYPKHQSHYSRKSTSKVYLSSDLNIKKIFDEYKTVKQEKRELHASYETFKSVFKTTGYRFKPPKVDTCKTCDQYVLKLKETKGEQEKQKVEAEYNSHKEEADFAYECKRIDKDSALKAPSSRVIVFDLQQVLSTPFLQTNIVHYKRLLSTYNLTVRDCSSEGASDCFMWHESVAGRGSNDIASCIFKKIMQLPEEVNHLVTYSDTCGGQNRNINMAVMFSFSLVKKNSLTTIDQKFLLPGHTHLECDSDHARIERAKKVTTVPIMIPRDWYQFVQMLRGKRPFKVIEMERKDFLSFSSLLSQTLVKRLRDTDGNKISWLKIKWLRYTAGNFGVVQFKYTLKEDEMFRTMDLRKTTKRGRPQTYNNEVPLSYSGPIGINPLKKRDLLSILPLIHSDCHEFYNKLTTTHRAPELDISSSESENDNCS